MKVTEVTPVSLSYLMLGGFVVFLSMISLVIKDKLYIGEVTVGTVFGIIVGPHVANVFDPRSWGSTSEENNRITLEFMRIVLATGLFAIGVELPRAYLKEHARSLLIMVVPTMAFGWLVVGGIIKALLPSLSFVSALVISACLTPTDPILSSAICGGNFAVKYVPLHIRQLLIAESAANDGLAYPFLSLSIYLAVESNKRVAFGKWFLIGWLYQVIMGTVLGALIGYIFSKIMHRASEKKMLDNESFVAQYLALALFTVGVANSLGSDDLLAAFAAGSAISWDGRFNTVTEDQVFSHVIDFVMNCACFIYIGAWLPFQSYNFPEVGLFPWQLVVLLLFILAMRRIPSLVLLYKFVPDIHNFKEALFCGHFGPMGVGAIFISTLAVSELPVPSTSLPTTQDELLATLLHPIVSFIVLGSVIVHGLSIPVFWYGRKGLRTSVYHAGNFIRTYTRSPMGSRTMTNETRVGDDIEFGFIKDFSREPRAVLRSADRRGSHTSQRTFENDNWQSSPSGIEWAPSSPPQSPSSSTHGASGRTSPHAVRSSKNVAIVHTDEIDQETSEEEMAAGAGLASLHPMAENKEGGNDRRSGTYDGIKNARRHEEAQDLESNASDM